MMYREASINTFEEKNQKSHQNSFGDYIISYVVVIYPTFSKAGHVVTTSREQT